MIKTWLIDDDPTFKFLMVCILETNGLTDITEFENGEQARIALYDAIKSNDTIPDLILVDINMPVLDGWGFLEALKSVEISSQLSDTKVFLLSSSNAQIDKEKAENYDILEGFLQKPIEDETVETFFKPK